MSQSTIAIAEIYTDGACTGNPGPGGWGVVVYFTDGSVHELGGGDPQTTNNRMEMQAATEALAFIADRDPSEAIPLYTDSKYLQKGITQWIKGWKRKGWKTAQGKPVLNQDLWETLDRLNSKLVQWRYVKGHSGNRGNDRCDEIARAFATGGNPRLKQQNWTAMEAIAPDLQEIDARNTIRNGSPELQSNRHDSTTATMSEPPETATESSHVPRELRMSQLQNLLDTLHMADEIAKQGYLISSSELADLMDVNASAVTSRGDHWTWRNWIVSRVRREGNQILWQLERTEA